MTFTIDSFQDRLKLFPDRNNIIYPRVRIHENIIDEAYQWCEDQFGYEWIWANKLQTDYVDIYFLTERDALMFKLRFNTYVPT